MTPGVRPLVAGNWKMNGLTASLGEIEAMARGAEEGAGGPAELLVCPPATLLAQAACSVRDRKLALGGQDCHAEPNGAYTGDLSAEMLRDAGATYVIVGHSERRSYHHETSAMVQAKAEAGVKAGLTAIICVGETHQHHVEGQALAIVSRALRGSLPPSGAPETLVIAYEPIWAIGTGLTPTPEIVSEMHAHIRQILGDVYGPAGGGVRVLYGGSVKPSNARELLTLDNVDGALVGGASLKASDFLAIASIYA
jgi:triosephosphate isomerase